MRQHEPFILTPITKIMDDVVNATSCMNMSINTYPISDYVLQSLFLKMTGFQEQKMKCITWELATDNYEYRYIRYTKKPLGECSNLEEKNTVLKDLVEELNKKCSNSFEIPINRRECIYSETKEELKKFYETSNLSEWLQKQYIEYEELFSNCSEACLLNRNKKNVYNELFKHCDNCRTRNGAPRNSICMVGKISEAYEAMVHQRNRYAHNTSSYQKNLPSLDTLNSNKYVYENYFIRFFLLIIVDKIFIELFKKYLEQHDTFELQ